MRTGRPLLYGVPLSTLDVRITPMQRQQLKRMAKARTTTIADVVREALDDAIERGAREDGDEGDDR